MKNQYYINSSWNELRWCIKILTIEENEKKDFTFANRTVWQLKEDIERHLSSKSREKEIEQELN